MIADPAVVARPDEGAPRLLPAEGLVLLQQHGIREDLLPHACEPRRKAAVNLLPASVIFQRPPFLIPGSYSVIPDLIGDLLPQVFVEVPHRQRPRLPGDVQRVRQRLQASQSQVPPVRLAAQLRGMVVHQDGEAVELRQQDVARRHHPARAVGHVLGRAAAQGQRRAAAEQRAVDAPVVRGIIMDDLVIQFAQRRLPDKLPQYEGILHLREADGVRQAPEAVGDAQQGLRHGVALGLKAASGPVLGFVLGMVVEEVLYVPKHDQQGVAGLGAGGERHPQEEKYHHSPFHTANMAKNTYICTTKSKDSMSLKCGIVGLPNVGKSTLFNCVSSGKAQSANFPFCTIEPNLGSTNVPDKRLEVLSDICKPQRTIPATVDIVDIAGLVRGASRGEGLGNQFLANIRECDAILHVLRCFDDGNVVHVDGSVDPVRDKEVVDLELQIKDLETVNARIAKVQKQATTGGDKEAKKLLDLLLRYKAALEQGKSCRSVAPANEEEAALAHDLFLLTNKPVMYVCNVDDASAVNGNAYVDAVREAVKDEHAEILVISARTESEIAEMEDYEDRQMFLEEMGLHESGVVRLIQGAYHLLGLQTFFTAGADECRAWTIHKGDKAPKAAGVIHTDFEKGFIRAEVIKYDDFVQYKTEAAVRAAGKMGIEGKDYVVQDGDIMHFLFNV